MEALEMASLVAAVLLLVATPQARGWSAEGDRLWDMVPGRTPAEQVLMAIPGDAGTMATSSFCAKNCRCCSRSNPAGSCPAIKCYSNISCVTGQGGDTTCTIVQDCSCKC